MKPLSDAVLAKMIARPMLHSFPSFAACIRTLSRELLQVRHEKAALERIVAKYMVDKEGRA